MIVPHIGSGQTESSICQNLSGAGIRIGKGSRTRPKLNILHPDDADQGTTRHLHRIRSIIISAGRQRSSHRQIQCCDIRYQSARLAQRVIRGLRSARIADRIPADCHCLARSNVLIDKVGRHGPAQHQGLSSYQSTERRRSSSGSGCPPVVHLVGNRHSRDRQRCRRNTCRRQGWLG